MGLDIDPSKLPASLKKNKDSLFHFNQAIIDATRDHCVSYKINTAFYEALGVPGWELLERTVHYIGKTHFTIADAKRGDIGNTSTQYAKAFFETLPFDAITVAPYMGADSVQPFLDYPGKWTILLALTSNPGAADFELQKLADERLFEKVIRTACQWGQPDNLMFVVGATQTAELQHIRHLCPEYFFLVPGIGAQGGSLQEVSERGLVKKTGGILVNASRAILYASSGDDFDRQAQKIAAQYHQEMKEYLNQFAR